MNDFEPKNLKYLSKEIQKKIDRQKGLVGWVTNIFKTHKGKTPKKGSK